ncbi:MAG: dockerin type I repeat-containing protein, partial [Gemmatimonadota bacterium]|nr:dockerin type I repeat-containing protein [Gemmatimonadota bacterium]
VLLPGDIADQEITGAFADSRADNPLGITVHQRSYAYAAEDDNDYVIVEYTLTGPEDRDLDSVFVAQHLDWDVRSTASDDMVGFDTGLALAYMYDTGRNMYVGHALLTQKVAGFKALSFSDDIMDGFKEEEKYAAMTQGVGDTLFTAAKDWSELLSAGPVSLVPEKEVIVAFAVVAGGSLDEITTHAGRAVERFREILEAKEIDITPPQIAVQAYPDTVSEIQAYAIRAAVTDESDLGEVGLYWRVAGAGAGWAKTVMEHEAPGDTFQAAIPGQAAGAIVEYYIQAADSHGNLSFAPENAPESFYSFGIIDRTAPELTLLTLPEDTLSTGDTVAVMVVKARDDSGWVGLRLIYSTDSGESWSDTLEMTGSDSLFSASFPDSADKDGRVYSYFVEARDSSGNLARLPESAPDSYFTVFIHGKTTTGAPQISKTRVMPDTAGTGGGGFLLAADVVDNDLSVVYAVLIPDRQDTTLAQAADTLELTAEAGLVTHTGVVRGYERGVGISYYIVAEDSSGNSVTDPEDITADNLPSFDFLPVVSGDGNQDGVVNIFDLITLLQALGGSSVPSPDQEYAMDLDRNGRVDIFDLLELLRVLSGSLALAGERAP